MVRMHRSVIVLTTAALLASLGTTSAMAAKGGKGGGGTTVCTQSAPRASIDNAFAWASPGSWGMPGQELRYAIDIFNNDVGCGSSSFVVTVSADPGLAVSMPSNTITLGSASSAYVWAHVTSPTTAADGDYPLTATVERVGSSGAASSGVSAYKVYTSDTVAPTLFWINPSDGGSLSGRTAYVGFASKDDHAVKEMSIAVDGAAVASTICGNVASDCQLSYAWSIGRVRGQHTATFTSTDWMGNVATQTTTFTVN
jgi:hypothetical protein